VTDHDRRGPRSVIPAKGRDQPSSRTVARLTRATAPKRAYGRVRAVPRVSIGLPVHNGERYLADSLESLLCQSFEDFELIISDNASTDGTAEICRHYASQDRRIRYFCQPNNIGSAPNHNFVIMKASGELFKHASHDDRYAPELLERCVEVLDECPRVVLAHSWSSVIDSTDTVQRLVDYTVATDALRAPDRFRSMLFDGWGDDEGGVVRTSVLRRTRLHGSYHFADRVLTAELALYGPFHMVPERLYFRREHGGQSGAMAGVRDRCSILDPRRANRMRHPIVRLYGEYLFGYILAIQRAPVSDGDRRECYRTLARWTTGRFGPVARRTLTREGLRRPEVASSHDAATQAPARPQPAERARKQA